LPQDKLSFLIKVVGPVNTVENRLLKLATWFSKPAQRAETIPDRA
jgi:hypothetical protein